VNIKAATTTARGKGAAPSSVIIEADVDDDDDDEFERNPFARSLALPFLQEVLLLALRFPLIPFPSGGGVAGGRSGAGTQHRESVVAVADFACPRAFASQPKAFSCARTR